MEKYFEIELMMWIFQCDLNEVMVWKDVIVFFSGVKYVSGMGGGGGMVVFFNFYIFKVECLLNLLFKELFFGSFFSLLLKSFQFKFNQFNGFRVN